MSKKLSFTVTLEFYDKVTSDEDIVVITNNIARAIEREVNNGYGIVPENGDNYTKSIEVKPQFLEDAICFIPIVDY